MQLELLKKDCLIGEQTQGIYIEILEIKNPYPNTASFIYALLKTSITHSNQV